MPTDAIRCPACGAADTSPAEPGGLHRCAFCGVRYRVQGSTASVVPSTPADRRKANAFVVLFLSLLVTTVIVALVRAKPEPVDPERVRDLQEDVAQRFDEVLGSPASTSVQAPAATPTPAPPAATFAPHSRRSGSDGSLWFYGVVSNTSEIDVAAPEVVVVFLDAAGAELGTEHSYAIRPLGPGDSAPVAVLARDQPAGFEDVRFEVVARAASTFEKRSEGLRVTSSTPVRESASMYALEGKVHNDGDAPSRFVQLKVIAWSADDRVVGIGTASASPSTVEASGTSRFRGRVLVAEEAARFEIIPLGRP